MVKTHSANLRWIISEHDVLEKSVRSYISYWLFRGVSIPQEIHKYLISPQPSPCCGPLAI